MDTKTQHTPTPWHIERRHSDPDTAARYIEILPEVGGALGAWSSLEICGLFLADKDSIQEANAEFIVRACNNHEALVKALTGLIDQADAQFRAGDRYATFNKQTITQARAALTAI